MAAPASGVFDLKACYRQGLAARISALETCRQSLADQAPEAIATIRRIAHTLRGSGGTYGFPEISMAARAVEEAAPPALAATTEALLQVLRKVAAGTEAVRIGILIVEDDEDMRKMVAFALTRRGLRVTQLRDGSKALEYLAGVVLAGGDAELPHVLLTDQRMPGVCGLDVIEATRVAGMRIPAILITAFGDADTHGRAQALGQTPVLDKPFEMDALLAIVKQILPPASTFR